MNQIISLQQQQPGQTSQQLNVSSADAMTSMPATAAAQIAVSNSPASPLASPSSANAASANTASFATPQLTLDASIGSQELHDALEAACCQAANSIMNENR